MITRYPTLTACVERLLGEYFLQCETREELQAREEAALVAVNTLFTRRIDELRTNERNAIKNRHDCGNRHDGQERKTSIRRLYHEKDN